MNETTTITYKCIKCQQPITGHQSYWFSDSRGPYCPNCVSKPQWPNHTVRLWIAVDGTKWRPIATAPKDGSYILLGYYDEQLGDNLPRVAFWYDTKQLWADDHGFYRAEGSFSPTHWMPLPDPPKEDWQMTTTLHWHPASEPPGHNRRVLVLWWSQPTGYCYGIITRRANSWEYARLWADLPDHYELFGNSKELATDK